MEKGNGKCGAEGNKTARHLFTSQLTVRDFVSYSLTDKGKKKKEIMRLNIVYKK